MKRVTGYGVEPRLGGRSRRAGFALGMVMIALSAFAIGSSQATSSAASRAVVASRLEDDYADAANALISEESLERKYRLEPGPDVQARFDETAAAFVGSLARVRQDGTADDRSFVDGVLSEHERYLRAINRLFRATDRGDVIAALKIDNKEVDPSFGGIETAVLDATDAKYQESLSQLSSLQGLDAVTRSLTPVVFLLGLLLMGALAAVTRGHRRLLQRFSDHHEGILASVGEGVMGVDAAGDISFANPAAGRMLGGDGDSLVGRNSCAITCATSPQTLHKCVLHAVAEAGTVVTRPTEEFIRVDGTRFPAEVTAAPQQGEGATSGVVLVFRDTTEHLAVERMKGEFVSAVSHELRTPLTSIRGALEMLNDGETGDLPPIASKMVATALRGSERLSRLISDIIDVERLNARSFPMHLADIEVRPVVDTAVSDLQVLAAESGISLVVTGAAGWTRCDADRLMQALINLIGNAIKFSPPGGTVEISAEPQGKFVQFTVADSGRGIPETHWESIFERFHQVDVSNAREHVGAGLGLAITKSIVEQHGGRIWVESVSGRGSTFRFTIPQDESGLGKRNESLDPTQVTVMTDANPQCDQVHGEPLSK